MEFGHVILTRFNLATPGRESDIRNKPGWLKRRFELFERYCLPSVGAQSCKDFTWIVFFDKDTPEEFKQRIAHLQRSVPFVAYYTGMFPATGWPRAIRETLEGMPKLLLTTRLDNDDALSRNYVERMQDAAKAGTGSVDREAFVITKGLVRTDDRLYALHHPSNAFVSWLERTADQADEDVLTASGIPHMDVAQFGQVTQIGGQAGWLQIVHGENVSNKVRGTRISADGQQNAFLPEALEGITDVGWLERVVENAIVQPVREMRDLASYRLKSLLGLTGAK